MGTLGSVSLGAVIVLCAVAAAVYLLGRLLLHPSPGRTSDRKSPRNAARREGAGRFYDRTDSADQLRAVMGAEFARSKVMGLAEYRAFYAVEQEVRIQRPSYRVFAQTALGEVIRSTDRNAHSAINSKRVDVLVIDRAGYPVLAVEYQGRGHFRGDAAARDAVKKEALRKAGVAYVEVFEFTSEEEVRRVVREALERAAAGSSEAAAGSLVTSHPFVKAATMQADPSRTG